MGGLFCNPAGHTTLAQPRGGRGFDRMQRGRGGEGRTEQAHTATFQPIPFLHPSVCELMVSPFFPTDDGRSRLTTSSVRVEVLGVSKERIRIGRMGVVGSVGLNGGMQRRRKGKESDGNEREDE